MKINDDHLYHGAALTQVAEHPSFKAINADSDHGTLSRSVFLINHDIGLYLKYASEPKGKFKEFIFTFHENHLADLNALKAKRKNVFLVLVCVSAREICCVPYSEFLNLQSIRKRQKGADEDSYAVIVTIPKRKQARVYMNAPGRKRVMIGERKVPRDDFPSRIFEKE